jgi:hypothetical protein
MRPSGHLSPDELYQLGLQHFNKGEWQAASEAFAELVAVSDLYPGVEELLADARLKAQFEGSEQPTAKAPPQRRFLAPFLILLGVLLLGLIGFFGGRALGLFGASPVVAVVEDTATAIPPTVQPSPTVPPPTLEPTALPTERPTERPTDVPSPTIEPTPEPTTPGTVAVLPAEGAEFVVTPDNIQFIIDASGSMLAEVPGTGRRRWEVAQEALLNLVNSGAIPIDSRVGVRTYGRNRGNDCNDVEVAHPLQPFSIESVINVINEITPAVGGMTPLASSLRAASDELLAFDGSSVIILVTDGVESCNGNPAAEAGFFVQSADNRKVHVIGFAVDDPAATENLRAIATNGGGLYFDANDSTQLASALRQAVELTYQILRPDGSEVTTGSVGADGVSLEPGQYTLRINVVPPVERELVVENGSELEVRVNQTPDGVDISIDGADQ